MKYERSAPVRIGHISELDYFVTDRAPSQRLIDMCRDQDVHLEIAPAA